MEGLLVNATVVGSTAAGVGTHNQNSGDVLLAERAALWLQRLPGASPRQRAAFLRWLRQSPNHVREMLLAVVCDELLRSTYHSADGVAERRPSLPQQRSRSKTKPAPRWRGGWWSQVAAAVIAVCAVSLLLPFGMTDVRSDSVVSTSSGEWQSKTLADGSIVRLGPLTKIQVAYDGNQRLIHLDNGDALFVVAKDPQRPFIVQTDKASVRAIGTVFSVSHSADGIVVTVSEGVVSVSGPLDSNGRATGSAVRLAAAEQVRMDATTPSPSPSAITRQIEVKKELAWTDGWVVFEGMPATEAIDEFNRRNDVQIQLPHPGLGATRIYGRFKIAEPEEFERFVGRLARE